MTTITITRRMTSMVHGVRPAFARNADLFHQVVSDGVNVGSCGGRGSECSNCREAHLHLTVEGAQPAAVEAMVETLRRMSTLRIETRSTRRS